MCWKALLPASFDIGRSLCSMGFCWRLLFPESLSFPEKVSCLDLFVAGELYLPKNALLVPGESLLSSSRNNSSSENSLYGRDAPRDVHRGGVDAPSDAALFAATELLHPLDARSSSPMSSCAERLKLKETSHL